MARFAKIAVMPDSRLQVRVNINLGARTIKEVLGQKKRRHLANFDHLIVETERKLRRIAEEEDTRGLIPDKLRESVNRAIMDQVKKVRNRHKSTEDERYTDDGAYRRLVTEMLDTASMAISTLRLCLEDKSQSSVRNIFRSGFSLRNAHRNLISYLETSMVDLKGEERRLAALRVCKLRGLVRESISEVNEAGESPLLAAATDGCMGRAAIRLLVAAGAPLDGKAARTAARNGHAEELAGLLEADAPLDLADEVLTGMIWHALTHARQCNDVHSLRPRIHNAYAIQLQRVFGFVHKCTGRQAESG